MEKEQGKLNPSISLEIEHPAMIKKKKAVINKVSANAFSTKTESPAPPESDSKWCILVEKSLRNTLTYSTTEE